MYNSENEHLQIDPLLLFFIVIQIIFIISGIAIIIGNLTKSDQIPPSDYTAQPQVSINDFSQKITNFPADKIDFVQNSLLEIVQVNAKEVNLSKVKADIREGSIREHYFSSPNLGYASAIIDLPELNQSYKLFLQSSSDQYNRNLNPNGTIIFLCVTDPKDIIYPDFNCTDIYDQRNRNAIVETYLKFFEFDGFSIKYSIEQNSNEIKIYPSSFEELPINTKELYIQQVKEAISSLGISPDLFTYYIVPPEDIRYFYPLE